MTTTMTTNDGHSTTPLRATKKTAIVCVPQPFIAAGTIAHGINDEDSGRHLDHTGGDDKADLSDDDAGNGNDDDSSDNRRQPRGRPRREYRDRRR